MRTIFQSVEAEAYSAGSAAYFAHQHTNPYKMDSDLAKEWQAGYSAAELSDNQAKEALGISIF